MKIFNWVHRRFNHKGTDEVGLDYTKAKVTGNGKDKLALLENAALDGLFDGWNEGILAIGTLGFDPALLKDFQSEEDDMYLCDIGRTELFDSDEDDGVDHEGEMEFPLVLKACKHGFFHDQKDDNPQCDGTFKGNDHEDGVEDLSDLDTDQVKKAKKTGERITLADLFWADSEKNLLKQNKKLADEDHVKIQYHTTESNTKHASNDHDRVALISKKKATKDRPIKKINQLVRKMLKKKIHPDVENQKETVRMKPMRIPGLVKNTQ